MPANPSAWKIGVARRVVTPPLGSEMAGFDARKGASNAVHDDLHARAMVFDDGRTQTVFVSVEVIAVGKEFSAAVCRDVATKTGLPAENVFLCATHTHCGPVTIHHFFNQGQRLDEEYLAYLAKQITDAAVEAFEGRAPRVLRSGMVEVAGVAVNRRTPHGLPVDPYAGVLLVEELNGNPVAVAVLYACHTTVLGPDTLSFTQDFPFYTNARLQAALGADVETLFFNGAEGDLSIGHKSDLSAVGIVDSFRTFATAQRLGEILADAVLRATDSLVVEEASIGVLSTEVLLPLKHYEPLAEMTARREKALKQISSDDVGAEMLRTRQQYLFARIEEYYEHLYEEAVGPEPKVLPVTVSAIRLGGSVFITLPGEVFVRIALGIRAASPFSRTLFLGLTNNYIGYVPDHEATPASGYEVIASRVSASAGDDMQKAAAKLLHRLQSSEG
jgi:hypothetical protein